MFNQTEKSRSQHIHQRLEYHITNEKEFHQILNSSSDSVQHQQVIHGYDEMNKEKE